METVLLILAGILALGFIVWKLLGTSAEKGCASCTESCCSHCRTTNDEQWFSPSR